MYPEPRVPEQPFTPPPYIDPRNPPNERSVIIGDEVESSIIPNDDDDLKNKKKNYIPPTELN